MQTFGQPRAAEDLSQEIDLLNGSERDMKFLSLVNFLPKNIIATAHKHEWREDALAPESLSLTASGGGADWDSNNDIAGLPVADAERAKLRVNDVLKLTTGEEVVVKSIDNSGDAIDLYARGHGATTAAAQGAGAFTAYIIGHCSIDGGDPESAFYYAPSEKYNVVQIFERNLAVSGKVMRSRVSRETERSRQRMKILKELLSQLNFSMFESYIEEDATNQLYTMKGLREFASNVYNVNGALTVAHIYGMVEDMITAKGSPSAIHASPVGIGRIERLMATYVVSGVSEYNAKMTVKKLSMHGIEIELHADRHCTDTELWVLDYGRISYGPMSSPEASGEFGAVVLEENLKQLKEQIAGYFTLEVRNAAAAIVRAYGCTS